MTKTYLAINLSDFHTNQKSASTHVEIMFISARNIEKAQTHLKRHYPRQAWGIVPKSTMDKNIVPMQIMEEFK